MGIEEVFGEKSLRGDSPSTLLKLRKLSDEILKRDAEKISKVYEGVLSRSFIGVVGNISFCIPVVEEKQVYMWNYAIHEDLDKDIQTKDLIQLVFDRVSKELESVFPNGLPFGTIINTGYPLNLVCVYTDQLMLLPICGFTYINEDFYNSVQNEMLSFLGKKF